MNNYYVSAKNGRLDIGLAVEAGNKYMAAIYALEILCDYRLRKDETIITDVEEVKDDQ